MKRNYKGVIFDLDGTLVDTLADIASGMNRALDKRGFPALPVENYRSKVGWGINRLAFLALPEAAREARTVDAVASDASAFYAEAPLVHSRPYPGVIELVTALRGRKLKTAIITNKPDAIAQRLIAGLFPPASFDIILGETPGRPRKPDPACVWELLVDLDLTPANIIFAGDSEVDIETALTSGCFPLGVSWGYRSRETILHAGAKRLIERPIDLLELL